jgi:tRNA threonylcarbamoyladenosine biosynthesis protein TsaE
MVVALIGDLGAGKTVFAKGVAEGLGLDPAQVQSPTFVIASEYRVDGGSALRRLVHADLYRLEVPGEEVEAAGLSDWLAADTLLLVEWADRAPEVLPEDRLEVRLSAPAAGAPEGRMLEIRARGSAAQGALERWRAEWP